MIATASSAPRADFILFLSSTRWRDWPTSLEANLPLDTTRGPASLPEGRALPQDSQKLKPDALVAEQCGQGPKGVGYH